MWKLITNEFEQIWQFPHCIGALDGKHIVIKKPPKSGTSFYNYKQTFSVVLMAIVDARYKFISIDIGSMGRFTDSNIFSSGVLAKKLNKQTLRLPLPAALIDYDQILPYAFVADEAFPLSENIMRSYPNRSVTNNFQNKVFNYRLSRARQTVECPFGILASRFRVFRRPFETKIESVDNVVKTSCVLHNYLRKETIILNNMQGNSSENEMPENQLLPLTNNNTRSGSDAFCVRQKFTDYFNTAGSVPWVEDVLRSSNFSVQNSINFVTPGEIKTIIKRLPNKKSPGHDNITNFMYKKLPNKAITFMTSLFNSLLRLGHFPENWKKAIIILIKKPGKDKTDPDSYRPISLLTSLSKIFEKVILSRLQNYLNCTNTIPKFQFGFKAHHSTTQ
ncbi:hypothetical protein QTP88_023085 [Uroleucon formosanum]